MADLSTAPGVHRPRNVDWKRAAALLYGDWGTSKAYVIGLAFIAAGFSWTEPSTRAMPYNPGKAPVSKRKLLIPERL